MADEVRLIDAGELIGYLHEKTFIDGDDRSMVYKAIEEQPTIEAEPVKHGRWERRMTKIYACSECTNEVTDRQRKNYSFCPYCGSKQDLGGD